MNNYGVYVGRFSPIHKGHEKIIRKMIENHGVERSLIIIGSSNNGFSLRHFFSYKERRAFILSEFPDVRLVGLPDYHRDDIWLLALDDILRLSNIDPRMVTYYGGSEEDVRFFIADKRSCEIVNRFEADIEISATKVRDCLIHNRKKPSMNY